MNAKLSIKYTETGVNLNFAYHKYVKYKYNKSSLFVKFKFATFTRSW